MVTPCALNNGIEMAELVENMPIRDKAKHCSVMCVVTNKCSQYSARALGITKELMDIIGPGNAEVADLEANEFGIQLAFIIHRLLKNFVLINAYMNIKPLSISYL